MRDGFSLPPRSMGRGFRGGSEACGYGYGYGQKEEKRGVTGGSK